MKRQALLSVGFLAAGISLAIAGCEDDATGSGNDADAGQAGSGSHEPSAGESSGGTGSSVLPTAGEGGVAQAAGGAGGNPPELVEAGTGGTLAGAGGTPAEGGGAGAGGGADACVTSASYGNLGAMTGTVQTGTVGVGWSGDLAVDPPYTGTIKIELAAGYPPFEEGLTTLTNHVLTGPDLDYATCGLCVFLAVGDPESPEEVQIYFVTGGTITVTEFDNRITGSASNLTFEEATIDEDWVTTPVPGGCETSISSLAFDEPIGSGGAGGAGG